MKSSSGFRWGLNMWILMASSSLTSVTGVLGQDYSFTFHEVEGVAGKPLRSLRNITQDPHGYMWFSGEEEKCLYRYDGKKMTIYRPDFLEPNSLGGTDINVVYADKQGMIWVGFTGTGLDRFDPATNTFTHFRHDEANKKSLGGDGVGAILRDRKGNLWIGTNGLDRFDDATGEFIHYKNEPDNPRSLSNNFVSNIYEDRQGVVWVATSGFPWIAPDLREGGLNRMESDGGFVRYMHDPNDPHSLISNKVLSVFEDSRGVFWVGTSGDGLHTMDRKTGKFERHLYDPSRPEKLSRPPLGSDERPKDFDVVTFITEDHIGAIWFGALWGGLSRYDPVTEKVTRYKNSKGYKDGNTTWNGFVSNDGTLWIVEQPHLLRVHPVRRVFDKIAMDTHITRFLEDQDGSIWAGSGSGLLHLDKQGKLLQKFAIKDETGDLIVNELLRQEPDVFWLGTHHGVYKMNIQTGKYSKVDLGFNGELTIQIEQDKDGFKWITTTEGGLVKYNDKTGRIKQYKNVKDDPSSILSDHVIRLWPDEDYLWVGTAGGGMNRLDRKTDKFSHYLPASKITYPYRDKAGTLWAGTSNGLFRYDEKADQFKPAGYHSVIATDRIYAITEDDQSNLWITTPSAVVRIDSGRQVVSHFGIQNGIEDNNIVPGAILKKRDGTILIGNGDGYCQISTKDFDFIAEAPRVFITGFEVTNAEGTLSAPRANVPAEELRNVVLDHYQNNISISFAMADYRDPDGNQFYSTLEGFDDEWQDALGDNKSRYFSVPPGNYTYRLRAYTTNGAMSEKSIAIKINSPWWRTWWAYGGYSLLVMGLLFGARKVIVRQERLNASLQLEHVELEKAKEVDRVKTSFFANISHEFRTPLTLIKGPVRELMEKYASEPKTLEKLKLIQRNSDLLLKLINQLLDMAKLESGVLKVEKSEVKVLTFVSAVSNSFESLARQKNVALKVEVPSVDLSVLFDKGKLETILINLINNAIKFTPSNGSVTVTVSTEKDQLKLSVSDTGIGIPEDQQQKIFERFHQVSEAHKEVGTGIGLALVNELVILLGGTISVRSEVGKGSKFTVTLPIETVKESTRGLESEIVIPDVQHNGYEISHDTRNKQNGIEHLDTTKPYVLVVEDNTDLRTFIIHSLGDEFNFLEAENGKIGLEVATNEIPDLIISDLMMPEMDGIAMTAKIRKDFRTSHVPVIILTAKATEEDKLTGLDRGADDYLTKPFNKGELVIKVRNAITSRIKIREKIRLELLTEAPKLEAVSGDEQFLVKVKEAILNRLADEQLSVESLAREIGWSRAQFYRKITALTGQSVNELIRGFRLQKAAQLLEQQWGSVSQVAYEVGFSNPSYFSKCFKEQYGVLPSEYPVSTV